MRRSIFGAQPARSLARAFRSQQPRRTFATLPTKDTSPPSPIEPSQEQAHPIGPFYQAILDSAKLPERKVEVAPQSSTPSPPEPPAEKTPKGEPTPAPETEKAADPVAAPTPGPSPTPAKRGRKPKVSNGDNGNGKSKSVAPSSPDPPEPVNEPSNDVQARARVVFGSSLAGPAERAERLAAIRSKSRMIAGVLVPPRPEEPDNCCMSGCVNCVWDRYRDDMEEWSSAHSEAERRLRAQEAGLAAGTTSASMGEAGRSAKVGLGTHELDHGAVSMDDDGGGSATNWDAGVGGPSSPSGKAPPLWDEELYKNVPVGIREFMKQEKRLKEKHLREGTSGG
ncbi:oxidoreductase-like domain-containing protein 1 [Podospora aff. communis PSN243]|uniref:Oxidoreductase-like domain-containing protein 1 n=1 Tax=Podospora aff. communis PSN243 TaxID=3040156 RepID=A0AAV9GQD3_9PEZI|nr:oxidoreductase-like domain-containing protein 1 [Podospora aff. communis PSN243]